MPFGAEFRCDHCGVISVLIIDRALVPLSTLQKHGEKVCISCGRTALREARFCQEGHPLVRRCVYPGCRKEFPVDHQRCDFCGKLQCDLSEIDEAYSGTVTRVVDFGAFVDIGFTEGFLHISEIANHPIKDVHSELAVGDLLMVKIVGTDGNGRVTLSRKVLGVP
jgi:RecJ-like exonuclease